MLVIDLGDRAFEVLHLPGHSPGSIGLWDATSGTLSRATSAGRHPKFILQGGHQPRSVETRGSEHLVVGRCLVARSAGSGLLDAYGCDVRFRRVRGAGTATASASSPVVPGRRQRRRRRPGRSPRLRVGAPGAGERHGHSGGLSVPGGPIAHSTSRPPVGAPRGSTSRPEFVPCVAGCDGPQQSPTVATGEGPTRPVSPGHMTFAQVTPSAPGRSRTYDTRFRRAVLYPLSYWGWR